MCRAAENARRGCGPCTPETTTTTEPPASVTDVEMEVRDLSTGVYGQAYKVSVRGGRPSTTCLQVSVFLHNKAATSRMVRVVLSSYSAFYTGVKAHLVKKGEGKFSMEVRPGRLLSIACCSPRRRRR